MSHHEDPRSGTEADAQRAEAHRVQVTGEDTDAVDLDTPRSTWDPANIPAHTAVQKYYFDQAGLLKRLDYITDVLGGVAAHYTFDHKNVDGLVIPQLRRVVRRTGDRPDVFGPTSFVLDYTNVEIENQSSGTPYS